MTEITDEVNESASVLEMLELKGRFILKENIDLEQRVIYINTNITSKSTDKFMRSLSVLEGTGNQPITIMINSDGGSVYEGFSIIDRIQNSSHKIITVATGLVASMAIPILCSGHTVKATRHASFMFHEVSSAMPFDRLTSIEIDTKQTKILNQRICDFMASRTYKNYNYWIKAGKHVDFYFDSDKALELGVISEIVGYEYE